MLSKLKSSKIQLLHLFLLTSFILSSLLTIFIASKETQSVKFSFLEPDKIQITTTGKGIVTLYVEEFELYYKSSNEWKKVKRQKSNMTYDLVQVKDEGTAIYSLDNQWAIYMDDNLELEILYATSRGGQKKEIIKYNKSGD